MAAEPQYPSVSVIIPHYNDVERLKTCLAAIAAQSYPAENIEIIVADNASPLPAGMLEDAIGKRAQLVTVTEKGAGPTRNGGAAIAQGAILAFTDSDCVPAPRWIEAGVAALAGADIVGGKMSVFFADPAKPTPTEAFERIFAFDNKAYVERKNFTVTANLFVHRGDFERIGPFRNGLSEDVEWCQRAVGMGYRLLYAPDAEVAHPARRNWAELKQKWTRIISELYQLALTQRFGRTKWLIRTWAIPGLILAKIVNALCHPTLKANERLSAISVLVPIYIWRFWKQNRIAFNNNAPMIGQSRI